MTISVDYVLADPNFLPTRSVDRSSAVDLKAYLAELPASNGLSERQDRVCRSYFATGRLYFNGKPLNEYPTIEAVKEIGQGYPLLYLKPGSQKIVSAGFKVGLSTDNPRKIATMLICSRSGLSCGQGISVVNAPGIVDEDYPDWVGVGLINHGKNYHIFGHGARIAQAMFVEAEMPQERIVNELNQAGERLGGFGHTGV